MIKRHLAERLAECRRSEVRLESVRIEHRDVRLHRVQWRAGFGYVARDMASSPGKDGVDRGDTICGCLHFDVVNGL